MRLYALCDQSTLDKKGISIEQFVTLCRKRGAKIIQYRNKTSDIAIIKSRLIELRERWNEMLIVNDTVELGVYCDGVHFGQEDLALIDQDPHKAIKTARSIIGNEKLIGLSTHNAEEIAVANTLDINYIGLGAYRSTDTKDVKNILGDRLDLLAAESRYPVAVIGGVTFEDDFKYVTYRVIGRGMYES